MDSSPSCVNRGGPASTVRLENVPQLERPAMLSGQALQALSCWQARPGEILTVVDPEMTCYRARITYIGADRASCVPFVRLAATAESPLRIEVYQALPEKERFELVLQKLTEIGVARIVPLESERSTTLAERDALQKKSHRWPRLVNRAARQCRRSMLPELMAAQAFNIALQSAAQAELKLMLYEGVTAWSLTEAIGSLKPDSVALLVGPEGGFTEQEVASAQNEGFLAVSVGPRIMRTETASIVAAALLQSYLGDLR